MYDYLPSEYFDEMVKVCNYFHNDLPGEPKNFKVFNQNLFVILFEQLHFLIKYSEQKYIWRYL